MKTAEKILVAIGTVTILLLSAAVAVRLVCGGKKKYYHVAEKSFTV
jgi:hypothetical protein